MRAKVLSTFCMPACQGATRYMPVSSRAPWYSGIWGAYCQADCAFISDFKWMSSNTETRYSVCEATVSHHAGYGTREGRSDVGYGAVSEVVEVGVSLRERRDGMRWRYTLGWPFCASDVWLKPQVDSISPVLHWRPFLSCGVYSDIRSG